MESETRELIGLVQVPIQPPTPPVCTREERLRTAAPGRLAAVGLAVGAVWYVLLYGQSFGGVGFPLWVTLLIGAVLWLGKREGVRVRGRNVFPLAAATLFFAAALALRSNGFLAFLNTIALLGTGALLLRLFAAGDLGRVGGGEVFGAPWQALGFSIAGAIPVAGDLQASLPGKAEAKERVLPLLRGVLLALPILAIFLALLCSADALFAHGVGQIGAWMFPSDIVDRMARIGAVFAVSWGTVGAIAWAVTRRDREQRGTDLSRSSGRLGFTEGMTVLCSLLLVFAAFIAVQFTYLFGGNRHVLSVPGLTYAEYARRGFAELVWVALLTIGFLLTLRATLRRASGNQGLAFQTAGTLLIGLTLCVLASALRRMAAYEAAYGATDTRLYVDTFITFLAIALVWLAATLWIRPGRGPTFAFGALVCAVGFVATLDVLNPDATVVTANRHHAAITGRTNDDHYLAFGGSDDSIPALVAAFEDSSTPKATRDVIGLRLRRDLLRLEKRHLKEGWQSRNGAREWAYRLLEARESRLPSSGKACADYGCGED